eukprot:15354065-Alexandrium_andersonii.AAC.1
MEHASTQAYKHASAHGRKQAGMQARTLFALRGSVVTPAEVAVAKRGHAQKAASTSNSTKRGAAKGAGRGP